MSHQTEAETANDGAFQGRCRISLANKCRTIFQDESASDLDLDIARRVAGNRRFVREVAYMLAGSGLNHESTDVELDAEVETLWPLTIAYQSGALPSPEAEGE